MTTAQITKESKTGNFWRCSHSWRRSANNTAWCLAGCAFGDIGTVLVFQNINHMWTTPMVFALAMFNGLVSSVILETGILLKHGMTFKIALKTALGMSFISMLGMETAMNLTDYFVTGGAKITPVSAPAMLAAGFLAPWPYNYWRLKKYGKACH